jgi:hypothetical protein
MKTVFFVLLVLVLSSSVVFAAPPMQEPGGPIPPAQNSLGEPYVTRTGGPRGGEPPGYAPQSAPDFDDLVASRLAGPPSLQGL